MSDAGYWKYKGAQQKFDADKHTKRIEHIMTYHGWKKIRDSTPLEDKEEKWDALWLDKKSEEQKVDYKTGAGVQDSHKKLYDKGALKVTKYAMFNKFNNNVVNLLCAKAFWEENPTRKVNNHGQVYWVSNDKR